MISNKNISKISRLLYEKIIHIQYTGVFFTRKSSTRTRLGAFLWEDHPCKRVRWFFTKKSKTKPNIIGVISYYNNIQASGNSLKWWVTHDFIGTIRKDMVIKLSTNANNNWTWTISNGLQPAYNRLVTVSTRL